MPIANTLFFTRKIGKGPLATNVKVTITEPVHDPMSGEYVCHLSVQGCPEMKETLTIYGHDADHALKLASATPRDFLTLVQQNYAAMGQTIAANMYNLSGLPTILFAHEVHNDNLP